MDKHTSTAQAQEKTVGVGGPGISAADLYLKTFDELKKEIAASVKDARSTERNTLLLCGGIIAYISGNCGIPTIVAARYLPLLLAVFGAFRVLVLMLSVNPRAQYLKALEKDTFSGLPLPGCEEFFRNHYRRGVGASMIIFWTILVAGTAALPHFLTVSECKSH
jgi:Na+(H+)/acetate symporter ActP